jgi:hypothetical protein
MDLLRYPWLSSKRRRALAGVPERIPASLAEAAAELETLKEAFRSPDAEGAIEYAAGDRLTSGDIVLMHFREAFRADVECFVEEARRSGLRPALLEDYLT